MEGNLKPVKNKNNKRPKFDSIMNKIIIYNKIKQQIPTHPAKSSTKLIISMSSIQQGENDFKLKCHAK